MDNRAAASSSSSQPGAKRGKVTKSSASTSQPLSLDFTPSTATVQFTYPEDSLDFWTHSDVFACKNNLLVRRFGDENQDFIFLSRLNTRGPASKFKFPSSLLSIVEWRMKDLIRRVKPNEQGKPTLDSIMEISQKHHFCDETWWKHPETIKACHFHLRPYKNEYNSLVIRFWQNIGTSKTFQDSKGNPKSWLGPNNSISWESFLLLYDIFSKLDDSDENDDDALFF